MGWTRGDRDGGFGWMVVLGSFLVHNLVLGTQFSFGIFFVEIVKAFDSNEGSAAWIPSLAMGFMMGTSPFTGVLVRRYSARSVALAGAAVAGAGMAIASQSTQLWHVAMSYGVISGIGFSLAYVPSIVVLAHYWEKRRSLATGIAVAGSGTGTLVMAAIADALLQYYAWQDALFIVGMLCMVVVACCACLYVAPLPPALHASGSGRLDSTAHGDSDKLPAATRSVLSAGPGSAPTIAHLSLPRRVSGEVNQNPVQIEMTPHTLSGEGGALQDEGCSWGNAPAFEVPIQSAEDSGFALVATCGDPASDLQPTGSAPIRLQLDMLSEDHERHSKDCSHTDEIATPAGELSLQITTEQPKACQSSSGDSPSAPQQDGAALESACEGAVAPTVGSDTEIHPETMLQALRRLWGIRKYRCLVFALGPTALGYLTPYTHLKAFVISPALQFSSADAALALSAVGIASVLGRVGMGRVADMRIVGLAPHIVRNWLFLLSGFGAGLSVAGLGAAYSLGGLITAAVGFGVFSGAILSIMPVITADAVGVADLPVALPIMYFVQVPGFVVGAPIAGWVKVAFDSYRPAFALSGGLMLLGAFALLPLAWDRSPRADDAAGDLHAKDLQATYALTGAASEVGVGVLQLNEAPAVNPTASASSSSPKLVDVLDSTPEETYSGTNQAVV